MAAELNIIEICRVAPANSSSQFSLPLTFLDMLWLRLAPVSRLFFYEFSQPDAEFSQIFLPKLKNSLSLTLQHYLPLAGNLTWPQDSDTPIVQYNTGDCVSLTIAETQADFHHLSGYHFRESVELHALLPDFPTSETKSPVIVLQITLFPNKGFSIGYVAHHGVVDGKSISMFIHSWAYICKNGNESTLPLELTPNFDRTFVEHQAELERVFPKCYGEPADPESKALEAFDMKAPPDIMLGTVQLTRENIETLKNSVLAYWEERDKLKTSIHISTFTLTSAYVMVCLIKARKTTAEKAFMGINVDGRGRLDPPLPRTYFGNCVLTCGGGRNTKDFLLKDGFVKAAVKVTDEALSVLKEGAVKMGEKLNGLFSSLLKDNGIPFFIAGSPRFELYKADFGWGRPRKVEMISIDKSGAFYLSDDRDANGGIEIGVGLKKHEAEDFVSLFAGGLQASLFPSK